MKARKPKKSRRIMLGVMAPKEVVAAIESWASAGPERTKSVFVRDAIREKLNRDGIKA
jgi:hypothetical protein